MARNINRVPYKRLLPWSDKAIDGFRDLEFHFPGNTEFGTQFLEIGSSSLRSAPIFMLRICVAGPRSPVMTAANNFWVGSDCAISDFLARLEQWLATRQDMSAAVGSRACS